MGEKHREKMVKSPSGNWQWIYIYHCQIANRDMILKIAGNASEGSDTTIHEKRIHLNCILVSGKKRIKIFKSPEGSLYLCHPKR
jgi:hypothetical protein